MCFHGDVVTERRRIPEPALAFPEAPPAAQGVVELISASGPGQLARETLELGESPPHPEGNRTQPNLWRREEGSVVYGRMKCKSFAEKGNT